MDLGVYNGEFTKKIHKEYGCRIFGFEPVKKYFCNVTNELCDYDNINIFNFGLGCNNRQDLIFINDDSSSIYLTGSKAEQIEIKSIVDVVVSLNIVTVDLIKINVEGCEFEILEAILDNDLQRMFKNIQVQFHRFVNRAYERRNKIQERLSQTHELTYQYSWVWENWKRCK
ncbi:MAG: FkbM family methyltransferase [Bacteroidales bacterium]|nr:FkbM family methyltransferase [Bacteroidales bacterium]